MLLGGAILVAAGLLFHMQGRGIVGPEQSFMYNNPEWFQYGLWLAASGMIIIILSLALRHRAR